MEYKDTLLMPKTSFEMKGNLKDKDSKFISKWKKYSLYDKLSSRDGKEFILHDGPPYANGDIHIGHALNKILKDFIVRNSALNGKKIDWRLGWDTHGLPIELKVQQSGIKLSEVGKKAYLKACFDYAKSQVKKQENQFEKLALLTNFDKKYLTLDKDFEARQIKIFNKMLNKGFVYQDLKPVYWSWSSETALADAEIEYKDSKDYSAYIKFKHENSDINFLIWTTTPWTIPANVGIAYGKKIKYSMVQVNNEKIIIADDLINTFLKKTNLKFKGLKSIDLSKFKNDFAINPLNGKKSKIIEGHHVTTESGTGLVHIAGGHGIDDYIVAKENNLELIVVQDDKGHMINSGKYNKLFYLKANKLILLKLKEVNASLYDEEFVHSIPIDWRTKEPVIYRATKQWFVSIESIKSNLIKEIKKVNWIPSWGEDRLINMTKNRNDWCISRQRLWGVPIPIIYDANNKPIIDIELQKNIELKFEKEGMMSWHNSSIKELLPKHIKFDKKMYKEVDILDVWFDSGSSNELLEKKVADVVLEGNDQYRGWFNSSMINSYISKEKSPYKTVITHGFITDAKGNKMSKSLGNTISPMEITSIYGADILRLWVASIDYQDNPKISNESIKQIANDYRTIRNTIRFILGNLNDYDDSKPKLNSITKSVLNKVKESFDYIILKLNSYNFNQVLKEILNQLNNGAIKYFLDYSKDCLYVLKENDPLRRGVQYALNKILSYIMYSIACFIPVTIEEANELISDNLFFEKRYPSFKSYANTKNFDSFLKIKNEVNKSIEKLRVKKIIRQSVESEVKITLSDDFNDWNINELKDYLMVGKLIISSGPSLSAKAKKFNGTKCERCWKYFKKSDVKNSICKNCKLIIS